MIFAAEGDGADRPLGCISIKLEAAVVKITTGFGCPVQGIADGFDQFVLAGDLA